MSVRIRKTLIKLLTSNEILQFYLDPRKKKINFEYLQSALLPVEAYKRPIMRLKHQQFSAITQKIRAMKKKVKFSKNEDYFTKMLSYSDHRLRFNKFYGFGHTKYYQLNPTYIAYLNWIAQNYSQGNVIDFATGLGNFLPYLEFFIKREKIHGVDNFSQVTKAEVDYFQSITGMFSVCEQAPKNIRYEILTIAALPVYWVTTEILEYSPHFILCETKHFSDSAMSGILARYRVREFDGLITVLEKST